LISLVNSSAETMINEHIEIENPCAQKKILGVKRIQDNTLFAAHFEMFTMSTSSGRNKSQGKQADKNVVKCSDCGTPAAAAPGGVGVCICLNMLGVNLSMLVFLSKEM